MRSVSLSSVLPTLAVALVALLASPASSIELELDPTASSIGGAPATGTIRVEVGAPLPASSRTRFDVSFLDVSGGGLVAGLDSAVANPGLGIVDPDGTFFVPTLFLLLAEGSELTRLAIPDLAGSIRAGGDNCAYTFCLDTSFSVSTAQGLVEVSISAIPEPGTALLVGVGLLGLARLARAEERTR